MRLLAHMLNRFVRNGTLRVVDATGKRHEFGGAPGPAASVHLHDRALHRKLFLNPELYAGEAYMDGTLTFDEGSTLEDLIRLFHANRRALETYPWQRLLRRTWHMLRSLQQYNPAHRARQNAAHHYDLSRQLYELFLDRDMQYSCAYFTSETDNLETAQRNKQRHIAAKLRLRPGQRVLDIGCGWGGLALYLASLENVEVTGVTLSREQHAVAEERARALGLSDRVRFALQDYREVTGPFDRIVSVGMFEHVGVRHYDEFFAKIRDLIPEDGVALLHSIGHFSPPGGTNPWLRKYIFPGGYSPAVSEVFAAVERQDLWVTDMEILRLHYAHTIREWHRRFLANRDRIARLYDERFCRMWEFYLVNVEMVFRYGTGMVFHMQLARERDAVPLTRDYMLETEQAYRRQEAAALAGGLRAG